MSPEGEIRNLKGQKATIAYKENQNDAFNYIVMSYDARGRVEAILINLKIENELHRYPLRSG